VGLVVAVPTAQGGVAGVGEKKFQRWRFNVAVAKHHVGFASHSERNQSAQLPDTKKIKANFWIEVRNVRSF
jgi:hypothetical protein